MWLDDKSFTGVRVTVSVVLSPVSTRVEEPAAPQCDHGNHFRDKVLGNWQLGPSQKKLCLDWKRLM